MPNSVCVTGASGFIGSHLVRSLLAAGHVVRATVRDPDDHAKTDHLRAMAGAAERLTLWRADLLEPGSYDDAVAGCDWVCHVAAAVLLRADDPQREIVDVAVKGTENVLAAIDRAESVTRVGLTSSIAAVGTTARRAGHVYTEDDWNDDATVDTNPYGLAKTLSERSVWAHHDARPADRRYDLTVVNPSVVLGKLDVKAHVKSSPAIIRDVMRGGFHGCPPLAFSVVDVADVCAALLAGLERGVTGRFIVSARSMWMRELATAIAALHPELHVPTRWLPGLALYGAALFDKRVSFAYVRRNLHRKDTYSAAKVERELGITFRPVEESLRDTCRSLIELGLIRVP